MTERKALTLAFTGGLVFWVVACSALMLLGASPEVIFLAMMATLAGTVYATSSVIVRYSKDDRDR